MTTALDLITGAAKLIGVVFKSEALSSDEANDGLVLLNEMIDTWSNDDMSTIVSTIESFSLTGAASYTIGSGGDFSTSRPLNILTAVVRVGSVDYPLRLITQEEYQTQIAVKSITSPIPQFLTYDDGYPLGVIKTFPLGTSGSTLFLQTEKPLGNFTLLTTAVNLPPGWKRALKYNLAVDMAPTYGVEVPASVMETAKSSAGAIRRATLINKAMPLLPQNPARYSIYSGTPGN